jgi:hypothetical protein
MPQVGFGPTIPVFKRVKTVHAFDYAATVIGNFKIIHSNIVKNQWRSVSIVIRLQVYVQRVTVQFLAQTPCPDWLCGLLSPLAGGDTGFFPQRYTTLTKLYPSLYCCKAQGHTTQTCACF